MGKQSLREMLSSLRAHSLLELVEEQGLVG